MKFQNKLQNLKKLMDKNLPPNYTETVNDSIQQLKDSNISSKVLKEGDKCPDFDISISENEVINIKDLYKNQPIVLLFYRGIWCPYCNMELEYLNSFIDEVQGLGSKMIGLSPQIAMYNAKIEERNKLNFKLYSDHNNLISSKFGLAYSLDNNLKSLYIEALNIDLEIYNNSNSWVLPMPSQILIDQEGIIRYITFSEDYTERRNFDNVINKLKNI